MRLTNVMKKGFSMVEVLAAIALLEIILVGVLSMYALSGKGRPLQEQTYLANVVLQRTIEDVRTKPFSYDPTVLGLYYPNFPEYLVNISQNTSYLGNVYLKEVVITVDWQASQGNPKSIGFNMIVADF